MAAVVLALATHAAYAAPGFATAAANEPAQEKKTPHRANAATNGAARRTDMTPLWRPTANRRMSGQFDACRRPRLGEDCIRRRNGRNGTARRGPIRIRQPAKRCTHDNVDSHGADPRRPRALQTINALGTKRFMYLAKPTCPLIPVLLTRRAHDKNRLYKQ